MLCYWWEGFINYTMEMGLTNVIYIACFISIDSTIQNLIGGTHTHTHTEESDFINLPLIFLQNKESGFTR
jgi:hypothetical protein